MLVHYPATPEKVNHNRGSSGLGPVIKMYVNQIPLFSCILLHSDFRRQSPARRERQSDSCGRSGPKHPRWTDPVPMPGMTHLLRTIALSCMQLAQPYVGGVQLKSRSTARRPRLLVTASYEYGSCIPLEDTTAKLYGILLTRLHNSTTSSAAIDNENLTEPECGSVEKADGPPATCFDLSISAIEIAELFHGGIEGLDGPGRRVRISSLSAARRLDTLRSLLV